jgi:outer membrane protein OmpA-like peptidoglycan-associated protein
MRDDRRRPVTPAQAQALSVLASHGQMPLRAFIEALTRAGEDFQTAAMSVELLTLYGLIEPHTAHDPDQSSLSATPRLRHWFGHPLPAATITPSAAPLTPSSHRLRPMLAGIIAASSLAAGCSHFDLFGPAAATPAPVVAAAAAAQPTTFYQNNMVYRFCQGQECWEPTPKVPAQAPLTRPRTTTVDMPGAPVPPTPGVAPDLGNIAPVMVVARAPEMDQQGMVAEILRLREALSRLEAKMAHSPAGAPVASRVPAPTAKGVVPTVATPSVVTPEPHNAATTDSTEPAKPVAKVIATPVARTPVPVATVAAADTTMLKLDSEFTTFKAMVQFADGSQVLDGLSRQKVIDLAPQAQQAEAVRVRGYAAVAELDENTRKLALGRAVAVKHVLVEHEVPAGKVKILHPHNRLIDPSNPNSMANRAVAIDVVMPTHSNRS